LKLEFEEYRPRKIINVHKHVDGPWFWSKYSAHPYVGCRSGCEFCYTRGGHYLGNRDPDTFDTLIRVKINAVELMRKELPRKEKEIIVAGDWQQPAEDRYRLSRGMLEVVLEHSFPLFIVERSPLLTRDLDLLVEINKRSWVGVVYSISSLDPALKRAFEPRSPGVKRRLEAMQEIARSGIQVGTSMMPIFPFVGDGEDHLEDLVLATKDSGGSFILAGGLTMQGVQAERTLAALRNLDPAFEGRWRGLYHWQPGGKPNYGPPEAYSARMGLLVRELCARHGLLDRIPRYVKPGPLAINKRIAEKLFLKTYDLELEGARSNKIWAYRKAAWTVDEMSESVAEIYGREGQAGLEKLPAVGRSIATEIARWIGSVRETESESTGNGAQSKS
jgi:DNA repair photolyase